jgi:hypothetical protein
MRGLVLFFALSTVAALQQPIILSDGSCTTRRSFWTSAIIASTACVPAITNAYERRDVGGAERSPEQAAFNEQAYETNNRLERQGLKLDTQEEQKASLAAALAEYSYTATPSKSDSRQPSKKTSKSDK